MKTKYVKPEKKIAKFIREYVKDWTLFEKIWLLSFTLINLYLFFIWQDSWIGLTASLTGMICVVLVAKGRISNYYFGIVNILAYAYVAYQSRYFGEVMLNMIYYLPMQFVGIYYWKKHVNKNKTKDDVKVRYMPWKEKGIWASISIIGIFSYGLILMLLKGTLPFVDSASTVLSVIAMILMVRRVKEQWLLWITIDVISIFMWVYVLFTGGNDISVLIMWSAFLVNAVYGYINWKKLEKKHNGK